MAIDALKFEHIYFDSMNRQQTEYRLNFQPIITMIKVGNQHNTQVNLIPFERSLGFSLIDYKKFRQDLINIELADI